MLWANRYPMIRSRGPSDQQLEYGWGRGISHRFVQTRKGFAVYLGLVRSPQRAGNDAAAPVLKEVSYGGENRWGGGKSEPFRDSSGLKRTETAPLQACSVSLHRLPPWGLTDSFD